MRSRTKVTIVASILLTVVGFGTVFSRRMQNKPVQNKPIRLDKRSRTSAIEVSNIEIRNDIQAAVVTLKNVSAKNVNGIQLSSNRGDVQLDFLAADELDFQRLLPGATYQEFFPLTNPSEPFEISVLAVLFDDKSSDGEPESVKVMIDSRRGFTKEMKRMRPLLEAALASTDGDSPAILDKLKSQVDALPVEKSDDSFGFRQGQTEARQILLYDVQFLKERQAATGQVQIRYALTKAKGRYDKRINYDH